MHGTGDGYYERVATWSASCAYRTEVEDFLDFMALPAGARVLDLGCGTGTLLGILSRRGYEVVGVDRGTGWRGGATGPPVVNADACALPFVAEAFSVVLLFHVFAHLARVEQTLDEVRRVLRPGGLLGIVTPNLRFTQALFLPSLVTGYRRDPTVERHVTLAELRHVVERAGLVVRSAGARGKRAWTLPIDSFRERLFLVAAGTRRGES